MRKLFGLMMASALALGVTTPAMAAPVGAVGSLAIQIGTLPPIAIPIAPTTVDVTGSTLSIGAGLASTSGFFVPVTGFPFGLITGVIVTASNAAGSFSVPGPADGGLANIPGAGFGGFMPIVGVVQVKGALAINVPISVVGKGGALTVVVPSPFPGFIAVEGAPWTTGVAKVTTNGGAALMYATAGTMMGALGAASSTVTLVTPAHINASNLTRLPVFAKLSLHFVPEPGTVLLLGTGIAGIAMIGRRRSR